MLTCPPAHRAGCLVHLAARRGGGREETWMDRKRCNKLSNWTKRVVIRHQFAREALVSALIVSNARFESPRTC